MLSLRQSGDFWARSKAWWACSCQESPLDFYSRRSLIWSTASLDLVHPFVRHPRMRVISVCDKGEAVTLVGRARGPQHRSASLTNHISASLTNHIVVGVETRYEIIPV